jgi:predicted transcriptional regulator of viral defense system
MHLKEFRKKMQKDIFSREEAQIVAFDTAPNTLKLQLHQWVKSGDLVTLKRGLYVFADKKVDKVEIARCLYSPCYISLEYALNLYGLIPDVPFAMTMVTPKTTRKFNTVFGQFIYRNIKKEVFFGFDEETLIAEKEKALVDYLYLNSSNLVPSVIFWKELRLQNLDDFDFDRALYFAEKYNSLKLLSLLESVKNYAVTEKSH